MSVIQWGRLCWKSGNYVVGNTPRSITICSTDIRRACATSSPHYQLPALPSLGRLPLTHLPQFSMCLSAFIKSINRATQIPDLSQGTPRKVLSWGWHSYRAYVSTDPGIMWLCKAIFSSWNTMPFTFSPVLHPANSSSPLLMTYEPPAHMSLPPKSCPGPHDRGQVPFCSLSQYLYFSCSRAVTTAS